MVRNVERFAIRTSGSAIAERHDRPEPPRSRGLHPAFQVAALFLCGFAAGLLGAAWFGV